MRMEEAGEGDDGCGSKVVLVMVELVMKRLLQVVVVMGVTGAGREEGSRRG